METNTKQSPKSCSCNMCKQGKRCNIAVKADERAYRHAAKIELARLVENGDNIILNSGPIGNYYD